MIKKYWFLLTVGTPIIIWDQWTKGMAQTTIHLGENIPLIKPIFSMTYIRNYGSAFGFLSNAPVSFRDPFFLVVPLIASIFIILSYIRLQDNQIFSALSLSLILAGALGNLLSRIRYGYVVDFLDLHWKDVYHWPAFNLADIAIVAGGSFFFFNSLQRK